MVAQDGRPCRMHGPGAWVGFGLVDCSYVEGVGVAGLMRSLGGFGEGVGVRGRCRGGRLLVL